MTTKTTTPAKQAAGSLESLFRPRGIAIAGAFGDAASPGYQVLSNLLEAGYPGHIAVLDATVAAVLGVPAFPALDHVPGPVEMLILATPAPEIMEAIALRARTRKDLKVVVALAGQQELAEGCLAAGVRLVGPNCAGILDNKNRVDTTCLSGVCRRPGGVSLLSQSGAMGAWAALELGALPVPAGLNKFITLGNMADVSLPEMLEFLGKDTTTRAVGLCLEGGLDGRALLEAAGRVAGRKPVVVLKMGRTPPGSDAVLSRTGAPAGTDATYDAAFRQYGLLRVNRLDDFAVTLHAFDRLPMPLGGRVSVLTNADGPGVYALDCLSDFGLRLAALSPSTRATLSSILPPRASIGQPDGHVDMTGSAGPKEMAQSVAAALRDPGIDAVLHLFVPTRFTRAEDLARELLQLLPGLKRHSLDKPYLPVLLGGQGVAAARKLLEENGVVTFGSPDQAAAALSAMVRCATDRQPPAMEATVDGRKF